MRIVPCKPLSINKSSPKYYKSREISFAGRNFAEMLKEGSKLVPPGRLVAASGYNDTFFKHAGGIEAIERTLNNPVGSPSLKELARGRKTVAILADDNTRPTPAHSILPVIIRHLKEAGVTEKNIAIIIAKGTHKDLSFQELAQKVGAELLNKFRVIQNNSDNPNSYVHLGFTSSGTPVKFLREAVKADLRVGVGTLSISPFAGISSGAKLWLPGISSSDCIRHNHKMGLHPTSQVGNIDTNVLRKDMEEAAAKLSPNYYMGCIVMSSPQSLVQS